MTCFPETIISYDISTTQLPPVNIFSSVWTPTHFCTCFSVSSFMLLIFYIWSIICRKMSCASLFCFQRPDSVVLMMIRTSPSLCSHILLPLKVLPSTDSLVYISYFVLVRLSQLCLPTLGEAITLPNVTTLLNGISGLKEL